MSKRTPGPWAYEYGEVITLAPTVSKKWGTVPDDGRVFGYGCGNNTICKLDDGENIQYVDEAEKIANGHLIAAAPEMLDALKQARQVLTVAILASWAGGDVDALADHVTIKAIDASIAKATGQSQEQI